MTPRRKGVGLVSVEKRLGQREKGTSLALKK